MSRAIIILVVLFFGLIGPVFSQSKSEKKVLYKLSKEAFDKEDYQEALPLLLKYDSLFPQDNEVVYRIGACYLNSEFDKKKAIPYLEKALNDEKNRLPSATFKDLAHLYHLNYQLDQATNMYKRYLSMVPDSKEEVKYLLSTIENARELIKDSLTLKIENIGPPVNTEQSEIMPFISADESVLYFQNKETRDFYLAYNKNDVWTQKIKLDIPNLNNYELVKFAGISPDGEQIFVQLGDSSNTDIYYGTNFLKTCNQLIVFDKNINSPYHECSISLAPDGNTLYFSSNRPGGYGGYDIYVSHKNDDGKWGIAKNLGPVINTSYDELYPFVHPSLTKLFFSSNGHKTMGGFDIFEASFIDKDWKYIKNIGFPINTTYDDLNYSMTAKGDVAYLSSTRNDKTSHFDIYKVHLKESIPLTLVKGRILAGNPPKPIGASIQVVDKITQKPLKYIYNPNPKTGQYLLIFPPGKDYDMIVKAKGYSPYVINIYIPNQTYFYENFQEITLSPITVNTLGETIGEEIQVKNTFYDIYKMYNSDSLQTKNYDKLLNIIEELIVKTDTLGLNAINEYAEYIDKNSSEISKIEPSKDYDKLFALVGEAIETTDSVALEILDENALPSVSYQNRYFYDKGRPEKNLKPIIIASDTIFAIQISDKKINPKNNLKSTELTNITSFKVFFEPNKYNVAEKYIKSITELAQLCATNPNLYISIKAYANTNEDPQVAISRAIEVRSVLTSANLAIKKTTTQAIINDITQKVIKARVELNIFESKKPIYKQGEFSAAVRLKQDRENNNIADTTEAIIYKVQIAAGLNYLKKDDAFFRGEEVKYYQHNNQYKYVVGRFSKVSAAYKEQQRLINKGFKDAFVVKFKNGVRLD